MTDQHSFDRSLFVARIFGRLGGMMFIPPDEDEILPLGNAYKSVMTKLYARRTKIFSDIKQHLAGLSDEALQLSFSTDGTAVSEEAKACEKRGPFVICRDGFEKPLLMTKCVPDCGCILAEHLFLAWVELQEAACDALQVKRNLDELGLMRTAMRKLATEVA
jgi:hypothetical protein